MIFKNCQNPKCCRSFSNKSDSSTQKFCSRSCATTVTNSKRRKSLLLDEAIDTWADNLLAFPDSSSPLMTYHCQYCKSSFQRRRRARYCTNLCRSFDQASNVPVDLASVETFEEVQEVLLEVIDEQTGLPVLKRANSH